jgi:hypothetical protein
MYLIFVCVVAAVILHPPTSICFVLFQKWLHRGLWRKECATIPKQYNRHPPSSVAFVFVVRRLVVVGEHSFTLFGWDKFSFVQLLLIAFYV